MTRKSTRSANDGGGSLNVDHRNSATIHQDITTDATRLPPRFDVAESQIDRVVQNFYANVRRDEILGAVFARHVADWFQHEAKIASFWKGAILYQQEYSGNPMQAHMAAGDVKAEHFSVWLALFDETLRRELPSGSAVAWSELAHRIGRGLRMGVEDLHEKTLRPPILC